MSEDKIFQDIAEAYGVVGDPVSGPDLALSACRNACQGHCCEKFKMSSSMEDRQAQIDARAAGRTTWTNMKGQEIDWWYGDEFQTPEFIQDMLVPLENDDQQPEDQTLHSRWYICRHFDTAKRSCTVYEQRPGLCRRYPGVVGSGTPCEHAHKGCTFSQ